jgi:hypothetical protein
MPGSVGVRLELDVNAMTLDDRTYTADQNDRTIGAVCSGRDGHGLIQ